MLWRRCSQRWSMSWSARRPNASRKSATRSSSQLDFDWKTNEKKSVALAADRTMSSNSDGSSGDSISRCRMLPMSARVRPAATAFLTNDEQMMYVTTHSCLRPRFNNGTMSRLGHKSATYATTSSLNGNDACFQVCQQNEASLRSRHDGNAYPWSMGTNRTRPSSRRCTNRFPSCRSRLNRRASSNPIRWTSFLSNSAQPTSSDVESC